MLIYCLNGSMFFGLMTGKIVGKAAELLQRYSIGARKHYRASSLNVYGAVLGKLESLALSRKETLLHVSAHTIHKFLGDQANRNTAKRYACFLDDFYGYFQEKGIIEKSPAYGLREQYSYPETVSRTTGFSSDIEEAAFLSALPSPRTWKRARDAALLALTIGTGLKLKEVLLLAERDIFLDQKLPVVLVHHGGHTREVPIREMALPYLKRWRDIRTEVGITDLIESFPATLQGGILAPSTVYRQAKATLQRAGIKSLSHLGLSTLRVSYARIERSEGNPVPLLQHRLGHKRETSTLHLLDMSPT